MHRVLKSISLAAACASIFSGAGLQAHATPSYNIKDLTPDGYTESVAYDVNSDGDAVGVAGKFDSGSSVQHFFHYDHDTGSSTVFGVGVLDPRGSLAGSGFRGAAINDSGVIAGTARFLAGPAESRGFTYDTTTLSTVNLGTLAGATPTGIRPASDGMDLNDAGTVTGTASSGAGTIPGEFDNIDVYTGIGSPVTDIDGDITVATRGDFGLAINNDGFIAGRNEAGRATLFSGATETVLLGDASSALDLNDAEQVVVTNTLTNASFRYENDSATLTAIPQIGTGLRMFAKGINADGDVVGQGDRDTGLSGQARGFIYLDDDATSYILEDVTVFTGSDEAGLSDWERLRTAWAVNEDGYIIGQGDRRFDGATFPTNRAYLLTPVPEPSSLALLLIGSLAATRRRR